MKSDYLFVYGSLAHPTGLAAVDRVMTRAQPIAPATIQGRLYQFSGYPGAVPSSSADVRIHGVLYRLLRPREEFRPLDRYEGCDPQRPLAGEYRRTKVAVTLSDGTTQLMAWTYFYNGPVYGRKRLKTGQYAHKRRRY